MSQVDVICIGNSAVDVPLCFIDESILTTDSFPINRIVPMVGGSGSNVSTILTHLGTQVKLITMLGKDMLGDYLAEHCAQTGIDTGSIIRNGNVDTPLSIGLVRKDGERNFIVSRSSSTFHFSVNDIDLVNIKDARLLHFASIFIMPRFDGNGLVRLFGRAKEAGMIVSADMMKSRTGERLVAIEKSLAYVDYFFANFEEASFLTGLSEKKEICERLLQCGIQHVIIKEGKNGCYIQDAVTEMHCPAFPNVDVVDTIGAGDNFAAGFITGILDGLSLSECARFANATASISVGSLGATTGVKNKQQVLELLKQNM